MAIGGGIGRFASRSTTTTTTATSDPAVPPNLSIEALSERPSTANTFASFDSPSSSGGFNVALSNDYANSSFEDPFQGEFEDEHFYDEYNGGNGNYNDAAVGGTLVVATEGPTNCSTTDLSDNTPTNKAVVNDASKISATMTQVSDRTYQRVLPPPVSAAPSHAAPTVEDFSPKGVHMHSETTVAGPPNSGLSIFGRRRSAGVDSVPLGAEINQYSNSDSLSIQASTTAHTIMMHKPSTGSRAPIIQNRLQKQVATQGQQHQNHTTPRPDTSSPVEHAKFDPYERDSMTNVRTGRSEILGPVPTQGRVVSTPSPAQQARPTSLDSNVFSVSHVTPDAISLVERMSPADMFGSASCLHPHSPTVAPLTEAAISTDEDFECLVVHFLTDLQDAEDLWDQGDEQLLALHVDMAETYAFTLRLRGLMLDILEEIDQGLELQDEVITEQQLLLQEFS